MWPIQNNSIQMYSANMVATVVPVVFEGFAFAAENLPAMKFLSCCAAWLFCEKIASMCHHVCVGEKKRSKVNALQNGHVETIK